MKTETLYYEIHYRYKKGRYWLKDGKHYILPSVLGQARKMNKEKNYSDIEVVQVNKKIYEKFR